MKLVTALRQLTSKLNLHTPTASCNKKLYTLSYCFRTSLASMEEELDEDTLQALALSMQEVSLSYT